MKTKGRVVVITGASAGVGRAIVRKFAREGDKIGLIARGSEALIATKREVEALGGEALVQQLDVSDAQALEMAANEVEKKWGRPIDIWINNAMVSVLSPVEEMRPEEYKRVTEVTYLGYVYGTLAALKRMSSRNQGIIIQIGSALGYRSIPLQSAYCAAKHAIAGFTESLRTELLHKKSKVKVCEVNLPAINTPQFSWVKSRLPREPQPVPPIFQPEVIANAVYAMSLKPRRSIDIAYSTVAAVTLEKIVPGIADHYLARFGYDSQQTEEPTKADREDNLWHPVSGDPGAHGSFDSRARSFSPTLWLDLNRVPIITSIAALACFFLWKRIAPRRALEAVFPHDEAA